MRLVCGICLSSQSDARAKGTDANEDWVAVTDCGHVYHAVSLSVQYAMRLRNMVLISWRFGQ